ncbi:ATP-binding protein [Brevibacillus ginsengisoli]|uniref:ATP-binding protein n=1 Tax=Brevibacillus ginsengisoli TaxID=363854 RepID=UPI003CEAA132
MKRFHVVVCLLAFLLLQSLGVKAAEGPAFSAVKGVLYVSQAQLNENPMIPLNGEWEFYWKQLLDPQELHSREHFSQTPSYSQVPAEWKNLQQQGQALTNQGYGTYRLVIQLDKSHHNQSTALYLHSVATAYKLWVNGELLASNGTVGRSQDEMVPKNYPKVVNIPQESNQIEIVLQVSNFVQRKGGLWQTIHFGLAEPVMLEREKRIIYESFIAASLLIMGLYNLGLSFVRWSNKSPLYFGLLSFTIAIRTLLLGETIGVRLFPELDWTYLVKAEYLTGMLGMAFILLFVAAQYPQEVNRFIRKLILTGCVLGSSWIVLTTPLTFTSSLLFFQFFILTSMVVIIGIYLLAALRKREGSILNGIGLFFFFLTCLNDTLYYLNLGTYENLVPLGLLMFLLTQMLNLAYKFSRTFTSVERLSEELQEINLTLEEKVKDRTMALVQSNKDLERINDELSTMEKSRRYLLTNISHELGTPLTSIQGFIKAMIDGVVRSDDPKYLHLIYDKTIYLNRIIRDLYELTKMESGQVSFYFKPTSLVAYMEQIYEKHAEEMKKKGLRFEFVNKHVQYSQMSVTATIDPTRIEQVLVNLLTNAAKYTPEGGLIRLGLEVKAETTTQGLATISVTDTGSGIAEEELPFLFDRFYKSSQSRVRGGEGVGLGLAISKEIVQCHQGKIEVMSHPGQGSEFFFTLPVTFVENQHRERLSDARA